MPHCEDCGTKEVRPADLHYSQELGKVVCPQCTTNVPKVEAAPKLPVSYGLHFTSDKGFKAEVAIGEAVFGLTVTPAQLQKMLKRRG